MNVLNPRPSAFDGMSWTATPPPYGGFGGHPYATGGMQQFDPQQQQQLPRHAYHPQSAYAPPQAPLLTNRNYQPIPHPYYSVAPYAPYAIQPSPAVNLGNGYFAQPSYSAFAPAPYAGAQPSYGYEQHAMPPPPYRAQEQMFSQYQQQQQPDETMRSQSRGRWQGRSSWEGERPASNEIWNDERREGYGWSESAQAATGGEWEPLRRRTQTHDQPRRTVDHDHPSFDRPPHRSSAVAIQQPTPQQVVAPQQQQQQPSSNIEETQAADDVVYDLVPNVSLVPPPPPVERSAVPLADLATEMVWEAYLLAVAADGSRSPSSTSMARWGRLTSKPASLFNEVTETNRRLVSKSSKVDEVRSSPRMPELFGAIGEGRARKVPTDGSASDDSSPSSSAPGTPAGVGAIDAAAARKQRMMGFGYAIDGKSKGSAIEVRVGGLESPVEAIRTHARRLSHVNGHKPSASPPPSSPAFASEPSPAFRQFVKQVLTATLLAPEDLVLALYYVARMPSTSLVQPPALEHTNSISAKASAIKAAPFKIILGALMLANKVRSARCRRRRNPR